MRQQENVQTGGNVHCDYFELCDGFVLVIGEDCWALVAQNFDDCVENIEDITETGSI